MPRYMFQKSRYGQARFLDVNEDFQSAILHGESRYVRVGQSPDGGDVAFVDFEGGPFVGIGDTISVQDGKSKVVVEITSLSLIPNSSGSDTEHYTRINLELKKAKSQKSKANWNTVLLPPGR